MHSLLRPLLVVLWATIFVPSLAQNNTAALIPIPNHIEKSKNGATTQLDKNTTITTSLQGNSFIIQELILIDSLVINYIDQFYFYPTIW